MASAPPDLPESIVVSQFSGIKNTVSAERLQPGELELAINVDIDDAGQTRRRRGRTQLIEGACHSLWSSVSGRFFAAVDGHLCAVQMTGTTTPLVAVTDAQLSFAEVGTTIYFSSEDVSGKILQSGAYAPWGATDGSTRWLSPVTRPTDTLGAISGRLLGAPPNAAQIVAWNGRIYLAHGNVLWATELFALDYVDKTKGYIQFESDITVLAAVDDGIYVGTKDALHYLSGNFSQGLTRKTVSLSPSIAGSAVQIPAEQTALGKEPNGPQGLAVMLLTQSGVIVGYAGGNIVNLTTGRVEWPGMVDAAALHREDTGVSSYVAVVRSGGDPATNARIGDFVDAEIRRATGS